MHLFQCSNQFLPSRVLISSSNLFLPSRALISSLPPRLPKPAKMTIELMTETEETMTNAKTAMAAMLAMAEMGRMTDEGVESLAQTAEEKTAKRMIDESVASLPSPHLGSHAPGNRWVGMSVLTHQRAAFLHLLVRHQPRQLLLNCQGRRQVRQVRRKGQKAEAMEVAEAASAQNCWQECKRWRRLALEVVLQA